jgi:hypothetical protein
MSVDVTLDDLFEGLGAVVRQRHRRADFHLERGERQSGHSERFLNRREDNTLVVLVIFDVGVLSENVHRVQSVNGKHVVETVHQFLLTISLTGRRHPYDIVVVVVVVVVVRTVTVYSVRSVLLE